MGLLDNVYLWESETPSGEFKGGVERAGSKKEVMRRFGRPGQSRFRVTRLDPKLRSRKMPIRDLIEFLNLFGLLLKTGMNIENALVATAGQIEKPEIRYVCVSILERLRKGDTIQESFASIEEKFPEVFIRLIDLGERSENLPEGVGHLNDYYCYVRERRKVFWDFARYPLIVLVSVVVLSVFALVFMIPTFENLYLFLGDDLNALTRNVLAASSFLRNRALEIALVCSLLLLSCGTRLARPFNPLFWLGKPFARLYRDYFDQTLFCRSMLLLMKGGNGLERSLAQTLDLLSVTRRPAVEAMLETIRSGNPLSASLKRVPFLPKVSKDLLSHAESTGKYVEGFERMSQFVAETWDDWFKRASALIHPVLFCVAGAWVLILLLAMYVPLFQIGERL